MGMSALIRQLPIQKKPNPGNNNENYEDILKKLKDAQDKAKKDLLSGKTSDKVDLKNGKNTEEAIMKFAKESEDKRKKALEELFNNLAKQVTNVFKNNSNIISGNTQSEKPQTPVINAADTSLLERIQTPATNTDAEPLPADFKMLTQIPAEENEIPADKTQTDKTDKTQTDKTQTNKTDKTVIDLIDAIRAGKKTDGKYSLDSTPLWSEEDKKDPIYERFNQLSAKDKSGMVSAYVQTIRDNVNGSAKIKISYASFKDYVSSVFANLDRMRNIMSSVGNIKPANSTQTDKTIPLMQKATDVETRIKQLETQLASMQEAYEKYQPKGLKEQIDKVQAELDKLRDSVANAPQPQELADVVATPLPANWTYGDPDDVVVEEFGPEAPDKQTENPQPLVINAADNSKPSITDTNNEIRSIKDYKIKQLETQLASMQEAYEKYQPKGLKEQIDKVQAELDKLRNKNN